MFNFSEWFKTENCVTNVEVITILAIVVVLLYFFYILNVFKKG